LAEKLALFLLNTASIYYFWIIPLIIKKNANCLAEIGEDWRKLAKIGENWRKLAKIGENRCKL
jgi:hypothetical protein